MLFCLSICIFVFINVCFNNFAKLVFYFIFFLLILVTPVVSSKRIRINNYYSLKTKLLSSEQPLALTLIHGNIFGVVI